jgi:hypothetical protein
MKNKLFVLGMLAVMLALGLVLAGCKTDAEDDSSGGGIPDELLGVWQEDGASFFEFYTLSGKLVFTTYYQAAGKVSIYYDVSVSGKTVKISESGGDWQFDYTLNSAKDELTISGSKDGLAEQYSWNGKKLKKS